MTRPPQTRGRRRRGAVLPTRHKHVDFSTSYRALSPLAKHNERLSVLELWDFCLATTSQRHALQARSQITESSSTVTAANGQAR